MPNYDPRTFDVANLEDIEPTIKDIVDEFLKLAEPASKFYQEHGEDAVNWANVFRDHLSNCCAYHRMADISRIQMDMYKTVRVCERSNCEDVLTHEFIYKLVQIVGEAIAKCINTIVIKQMLAERVN